jgi:FHA domain-containing protein
VITIRITGFNGAPALPQEATFGEAGGTIGRADGNTLVLDDPQKTISRTHAHVFAAGGRWVIEDRGTATPVLVNNRPLGNGVQAPIGDGDVVVIGGYTLQVIGQREPAAPAPAASGRPKDDPLALFGGDGPGGANPFDDLIPRKPQAPVAPPARPSARAKSAKDDPLALFGGDGPGGANPFDDLIPRKPQAPAGPAARPPAPAKSASAIPDDFDPFGTPPAPAPDPLGASASPLPHDFDFGLGPSTKTPSVDELYDLKPTAGHDPFGPDHPLSEPLDRPRTGSSVDPLVAIGAATPPDPGARPAQRDDVPEIHGSFRPPEAKPDPAAEKSMLVSWQDDARSRIKTVVIPSPARPGKEPAQPAAPPRAAAPAAAPRPAPPAPRERPLAPSAADEALLRAFLDGAGVPDVQIPGGLTPQLMQVFGQLLRTATQGTLELLVARALTKREVQAPVTIIAARENNPLKFSPTVEVAMQHLLAPQGKGFMSPPRAMKDAYDDLRAHQFGVVAGTRGALAGVLARFDPAELEKRLTQRSVLDTLLPMNRKAALWELFIKLYADIASEAEEDFHTLFGREFLKAYQAQIAKLEGQDRSGGKD